MIGCVKVNYVGRIDDVASSVFLQYYLFGTFTPELFFGEAACFQSVCNAITNLVSSGEWGLTYSNIVIDMFLCVNLTQLVYRYRKDTDFGRSLGILIKAVHRPTR